MEPKVAILLAYYNAEEYFAEQLYSVLGQSYKNLHIFKEILNLNLNY